MTRSRMFTGFRNGFWKKSTAIEVFKFSLYVVFPVFASVVYANPKVMHDLILQLKLVEYPEAGPAPPVGDEINQYRLSKIERQQK